MGKVGRPPKANPDKVEDGIKKLEAEKEVLRKEIGKLSKALKNAEPKSEIGTRLELLNKRLEGIEKHQEGLSMVLKDLVVERKRPGSTTKLPEPGRDLII